MFWNSFSHDVSSFSEFFARLGINCNDSISCLSLEVGVANLFTASKGLKRGSI